MNEQPSAMIVGASSDIGLAVARVFAANGFQIQMAARRPERLEREAADIRNRADVSVTLHMLDILEYSKHPRFLDELKVFPTAVICLVGLLEDQGQLLRNSEATRLVMETNYVGPALFLGELANRFETMGSGTIIGVSSVAGDRGRASNYVYGSAKAGFTAFLSGLRNRLAGSGVHVMTVKPGFVATRMTADMDLPEALTAQPSEVAGDIYRAFKKQRDVVYTRWMWRWVMLVIRCLPEQIFKRTRL